MLRIYSDLISLIRDLAPMIRQIERHDPDLGRQCRRALASAPLNMAEGSYSKGANRNARYHTAMGSLREVLSCFEVAAAFGYLPALDPTMRGRLDRQIGTLVRVLGYC